MNPIPNPPAKKAPRRRDDRVILHFDYDCFYAQVAENRQPSLKALPLGIKQKAILATCNYEARRRGVKKLMLIAEARKICPDLVLVDGEDLSEFRDVSKRLYALLRSYSWSRKVERLGLDEVFLDVTDIVAYNVELLNQNSLPRSWFCLSREDPEKGFFYDATAFAGCVDGAAPQGQAGLDSPVYMRLLLASHLGWFLRLKLEDEGYTSACGIATNKLLAKLAGNRHKPQSQTTFLSLGDAEVLAFMDGHGLRKVPGIGSRIAHVLEDFVLGKPTGRAPHTLDCSISAGQLRTHPDISAQLLEKLLGGPGSERGLGTKVWGLLHGVDDAEVKSASDVPTQISIEDTYQGLNSLDEINRELRRVAGSLLRRMHVDLVEDTPAKKGSTAAHARKWIAHPRTVRLTTRPKTSDKPYNWARASRSQPLPGHVFSLATPPAQVVERLAAETLLPMFQRLNPERGGWNTGLINICVTNMVPAGGDAGPGNGRDIAVMFRRQEDVLREFRVREDGDEKDGGDGKLVTDTQGRVGKALLTAGEFVRLEAVETMELDTVGPEPESDADSDVDVWAEGEEDSRDGMERCSLCDHLIPTFAMSAHERFHSVEGE